MKVIVISEGFFDNALKRVGETFDYPAKKNEKLPSWVKKAELTKEDEAERIKAEAEAKEAREKAEKEAADAKLLAERYNDIKVKAEGLGIVVENEDRLTIGEAVEAYEKAISDKEASDKADAKAKEKEAEEAEAKARAEAEYQAKSKEINELKVKLTDLGIVVEGDANLTTDELLKKYKAAIKNAGK